MDMSFDVVQHRLEWAADVSEMVERHEFDRAIDLLIVRHQEPPDDLLDAAGAMASRKLSPGWVAIYQRYHGRVRVIVRKLSKPYPATID